MSAVGTVFRAVAATPPHLDGVVVPLPIPSALEAVGHLGNTHAQRETSFLALQSLISGRVFFVNPMDVIRNPDSVELRVLNYAEIDKDELLVDTGYSHRHLAHFNLPNGTSVTLRLNLLHFEERLNSNDSPSGKTFTVTQLSRNYLATKFFRCALGDLDGTFVTKTIKLQPRVNRPAADFA